MGKGQTLLMEQILSQAGVWEDWLGKGALELSPEEEMRQEKSLEGRRGNGNTDIPRSWTNVEQRLS